MTNKRAIFINTASQIVVRVVTLVFSLISIKLLSNYLGPSGIGNYNTIVTYVNFFIVIADLGLFAATVREVSKNPDQEKKIISNVFLLRLISALVATIVAVLIVYSTDYPTEIKMGVLIATGYLFFNLLASIYDMVLQYRLKMQYSALAEFLSKLITLSALYLLIINHFGFVWIVGTVSLSGILIFLFKWIFAKKFISISPAYDKKIFNWVFSISWPLGLVFIVNNLFFKIDSLMLYTIKGASEAGIYSVAYKVLDVTIFVGAYFASSLKPVISENIDNNKEVVSQIVEKSFYIMLITALPITLVGVIFSQQIILFLSNADFISGYRALIIISFVLPFVYCDMLLGEVLLAEDRRKLLVNIAIFILSFNVILNLILIPKYSFIGAAYVTLISEIVLFAINYFYTSKILKYQLNFGTISKIVFVAILTAVVAIFLNRTNLHFLISIIISTMMYFVFANIFKVINRNTIKNILSKNE